ncbi:hypothetical protein CCMA1212_007699 [Trichoderma ghanense]|uniref:L-tryptophan decarboxylase PsiD-like domain-containing protein n=1 Tax=Trichoderma ghanense TaxID=65468 RepID=A0ABY2GX61_9HYPO
MAAKLPVPHPVCQPPFRRISHCLPEKNDLNDPVQDLKDHIESSPELRMLAQAILDKVPNKESYINDPIGNKQIKSLNDLYLCYYKVMTSRAPIWRKLECDVGPVGFPFNAVLDWPMATPSGFAFFLKPSINNNPPPQKCDGVPPEAAWLSPESRLYIENDTNPEGENLKFEELFECDPTKDYWGYTSWDDFFTRKFKNNNLTRPIAFEDDDDSIVNSCEPKPFALQANAKDNDEFRLKGQTYSVMDMLDNNPSFASKFVGGTVYQAFLSATPYLIAGAHLSTYSLLVPKETKITVIPEATPRKGQKHIPIRSALARVHNDNIKPVPEI